jgi:glycosyltransferase involved in cell wall biosynthesis
VSPRALTILHVAAPSPVGGLERVLDALAAGLARRGHRVHLAAVLDRGRPDPPLLASLGQAGVRIHPIRLAPRAYLRERREVRRLCRTLAPDVVHTHSDRPDVLDAPVARRLGIPTVTTLHGSSKMGGKASVYEWMQERMLRHFSAVIAVAQPLVPQVVARGVAAERVHFIPNAWGPSRAPLGPGEARAALGVPEAVPLIGWVGRLIPVKAADQFVAALAQVRTPGWQAVVIGDGPTRSATEARAEACGLASRIRFLGTVPDAAPLYSGFDVFVLSSRSEGTPITILEAMAARVPIVATRVGGVPDMLADTDAALVEAAQPEALAAAIDGVLGRREDRAALTARAAERLAEQYGLEPWIDAHERVYRQLAAGSR